MPRIIDSLGRTVDLRGVNKFGFEADVGGGWWNGVYIGRYDQWIQNFEHVKADLERLKYIWNVKAIRFHQAVDFWKYDTDNYRQIIKELLTEMKNLNLYALLDFYTVESRRTGGLQDDLPYPPYQRSPNASAIIANEQEFIDVWLSIALELQGFDNTFFDLWNEAGGEYYKDSTARESWFTTIQEIVDGIRSVGIKTPIIVHLGYNNWVNLNYPPPENNANTMDWVWEYPINDPYNKIVYSSHIYRSAGSFHRTFPDGTRTNAYTKEDIDTAFNYMKLYQVAKEYPLLIGELGANLDAVDLENELVAFDNCLQLFTEHQISYIGWIWSDLTNYRLRNLDYTPNISGKILINYLKTTPISPWDNFLKIISPIGIGLYFIGKKLRRG